VTQCASDKNVAIMPVCMDAKMPGPVCMEVFHRIKKSFQRHCASVHFALEKTFQDGNVRVSCGFSGL
jgi:hypothetical protein